MRGQPLQRLDIARIVASELRAPTKEQEAGPSSATHPVEGKTMHQGTIGAQIGTLVDATSGVQLANGFFGTFIALRVVAEGFDTSARA